MATKIPFKRGDTFIFAANVTDPSDPDWAGIAGWNIRSQIRAGDTLVAELDIDITDASAGDFTLSYAGSTESWPVRSLDCDIEYTNADGQVISTDTFQIDCKKDVTRGS